VSWRHTIRGRVRVAATEKQGDANRMIHEEQTLASSLPRCPFVRFPGSVWYLFFLSHFDNPHFIHRNKSHVTLQNNGKPHAPQSPQSVKTLFCQL
jgi:hypothetical protein